MNSETWLFEDNSGNKHLVHIAATKGSLEWADNNDKQIALLRAKGYLTKYMHRRIINHWEFYKNEPLPYSAVFVFLESMKLLFLTPLQLNVVLMYREGLSFEDVMSALGLKKDWLKQIINRY